MKKPKPEPKPDVFEKLIGVRVSADVHEILKTEAASEFTSIAGLVRRVLSTLAQRRVKAPKGPNPFKLEE